MTLMAYFPATRPPVRYKQGTHKGKRVFSTLPRGSATERSRELAGVWLNRARLGIRHNQGHRLLVCGPYFKCDNRLCFLALGFQHFDRALELIVRLVILVLVFLGLIRFDIFVLVGHEKVVIVIS